jgi:hypothetical protein
MKLNKKFKALLLAVSMLGTSSAFATSTYTYTDSTDSFFSGSFSVATPLTDGTYNLLTAPASDNFTNTFFSALFTHYTGKVTASVTFAESLFNVTVTGGQVTAWDIVAKGTAGWCGGIRCGTSYSGYYVATTSNSPGNSLQAFTVTGPRNDSANITSTLAGNGIWTGGGVSTVAAPIPEPETYCMMLAGLALMGFMVCCKKSA